MNEALPWWLPDVNQVSKGRLWSCYLLGSHMCLELSITGTQHLVGLGCWGPKRKLNFLVPALPPRSARPACHQWVRARDAQSALSVLDQSCLLLISYLYREITNGLYWFGQYFCTG